METLKTMAIRKSTRSYKPEQISEKDLDTILCAGCAAPVAMGAYAEVHLTVIQKAELLDKITTTAANAFKNPAMKPFYGAPTVVIVSAKKGKFPNAEIGSAACIVENMHLAATDLGLGSVYLWGFLIAFSTDLELVKELQLPEGFSPVSAIALGYPVQPLTEVKEFKRTIVTNTIQ